MEWEEGLRGGAREGSEIVEEILSDSFSESEEMVTRGRSGGGRGGRGTDGEGMTVGLDEVQGGDQDSEGGTVHRRRSEGRLRPVGGPLLRPDLHRVLQPENRRRFLAADPVHLSPTHINLLVNTHTHQEERSTLTSPANATPAYPRIGNGSRPHNRRVTALREVAISQAQKKRKTL